MNNVVDLFAKELTSCSYIELTDNEIGLSMLDKSLMVLPLNTSEFYITLGSVSKLFTRAELAEFLQVAAVFIDSEDRFLPDLDLIGYNYN